MKKSFSTLLILALLISVFSGCNPNAAAQAPQNNNSSSAALSENNPTDYTKLIIGLDDSFAPMGFREADNTLVGFDIDLAIAVGEALGMEIEFQPIVWDTKEMELESRNIDCVWNGMSRTAEREKMWVLSQNYLNNRIIIMSNPDVEIKSKDDLKNYQIGTQAKSAALEIITSDPIFSDISANLFEYPSYDECILDMQSGRIQVMIVDEVLGEYKNNNLNSNFAISEIDFGDDMYCIGFRKEDTALCSKIEDGIKQVIASGKGQEISEKWFGKNLILNME